MPGSGNGSPARAELNRLSRPRPIDEGTCPRRYAMKSLVVYESRFGNTALIARAVADALRERGSAHMLPVDEVTAADLDGLDLLVVGGPTHAHGVSSEVGAWLK